MRRAAGALVAVALAVPLVAWRLWTPIQGARLGFAGGAPAATGIALLLLFALGVLAWLLVRGAPPAAAALAAGVCLVAQPTVAQSFAALAWPVALFPWLLAALEKLPRRLPLAQVAPLAAALLVPRARADWLGLVVPRLPGAPFYPGAAVLCAAVAALALRRDARSGLCAAVAAVGLVAGFPLATLLALAALAADGAAAVAEAPPAAARALAVVAWLAAVIAGCAVVATARPGRPAPLHDPLVTAFFAWTASTWALHALATAEPRWRRLLLIAVALVATSDAWFGNFPRIEASFAPPSAGRASNRP